MHPIRVWKQRKSKPKSKNRVAYNRWWRENNRERQRANVRRWKQSRPEEIRKKWLRSDWGMTVGEYDEMLEFQMGRCAMCNRHHTEFKVRLAIDHDHKTGLIRGLLCTGCNIRLGYFEDEDFIKTVNKYLRRRNAGH